MIKLSKIELIIVLGFYYLDKKENIDTFTRLFNQKFKKDFSKQTIMYHVSCFKKVDPSNNLKITSEEEEYSSIWDEYIGSNRIDVLRNIYRTFKYQEAIYSDMFIIQESTGKPDINILDTPKNKPELVKVNDELTYPRDKTIVTNALSLANYKCEASCDTVLFIRKNTGLTYTEGHHLIPLKHQERFKYSLDVEANVVSLCPNCHRRLHYGEDVADLLLLLFNQRKERLKKCGINITYEELLMMYQ